MHLAPCVKGKSLREKENRRPAYQPPSGHLDHRRVNRDTYIAQYASMRSGSAGGPARESTTQSHLRRKSDGASLREDESLLQMSPNLINIQTSAPMLLAAQASQHNLSASKSLAKHNSALPLSSH
jgi:hypothetical protein